MSIHFGVAIICTHSHFMLENWINVDKIILWYCALVMIELTCSLTLSAHAHEGYSSRFACVCVCVGPWWCSGKALGS